MQTSRLSEMMAQALPPLRQQKKMTYQPSLEEIEDLYNVINHDIFNNALTMPKIILMNRTPGYWGWCIAKSFTPDPDRKKSVCWIKLAKKWYCKQWLILVLAHEMVHQYQYEVESIYRLKRGLGPIMSHGPTFFAFRDKLAKHGIPLRKSHSQTDWFKYQDVFKC